MIVEERRTLAARLSGPLQSWGEHSPYTHRGTLPYPTYSGLLGLARASLGSPRHADPADWAWLRSLGMAVRVDVPGALVRDYHTVNPPPTGSWTSPVGAGRKNSKSNQIPYLVPVGGGRAWSVGNTPSTLITERLYLSDAAFTWLVEGPRDQVDQLATALARPKWQVSLGRKACTPDWPILLGSTGQPIMELAARLPIANPTLRARRAGERERPEVEAESIRSVDLHVLQGLEGLVDSTAVAVVHSDSPIGSHPHAGHLPWTRRVISVTAPVTDRPGLISWAAGNLEHP